MDDSDIGIVFGGCLELLSQDRRQEGKISSVDNFGTMTFRKIICLDYFIPHTKICPDGLKKDILNYLSPKENKTPSIQSLEMILLNFKIIE